MTQAALQLQAAGFELALMGDGGLVVSPKSRLTDDTRQFIKAHKQELVEYLSRHAVNDVQAQADTSDKAVNDWQQADRAYQAHHAQCPICRAAGLGKGSRCAEGQASWDAYEAAPMPELGKAKRVAPHPPAPARQKALCLRQDAGIDWG
jgi:hypothetical protein